METQKQLPCEPFILMSAFDYSIGRTTYISGMTAEWFEKNWEEIDEETRNYVKRRLNREIEMHTDHIEAQPDVFTTNLGHKCDADSWIKLAKAIKIR